MIIPDLPHEKITDPNAQDYMHPAWFLTLTQLFSQLQQNFSNEGTNVPVQSTANVSQIANGTKDVRFLYDNEAKELRLLVNGSVLTVPTTP